MQLHVHLLLEPMASDLLEGHLSLSPTQVPSGLAPWLLTCGVACDYPPLGQTERAVRVRGSPSPGPHWTLVSSPWSAWHRGHAVLQGPGRTVLRPALGPAPRVALGKGFVSRVLRVLPAHPHGGPACTRPKPASSRWKTCRSRYLEAGSIWMVQGSQAL